MRALLITMTAVAVVVAASGCGFHSRPVAPPQKLTAPERNFEAVWQASRQVLRKYYFDLDRADRRAGVIVTRPMTGKVAGEFWRRDAASLGDLTESTIQTIYRQAKVTVEPTGPEKQDFQAVVEVRTYRSNLQEMQISSVSDAYDLFKLPGSANRREKLLDYGLGHKAKTVMELGRDPGLEEQIAAEIQAATPRLRAKL